MDGEEQQQMDTTSQVSEGSATTSGAQAGKKPYRRVVGNVGPPVSGELDPFPLTPTTQPPIVALRIATDKKGPIMNVLKKGSRLEA
jgi:hypothetical protein